MRGGARPLTSLLVLVLVLTLSPGQGARDAAAELRALVASGDVAADGTTLDAFEEPVASDAGEVLFVGTTSALMTEDGSFHLIARTGDPLPPPLSGTFNTFTATAINDAGALAFRATLNSADADEGVFLLDRGELQTVALAGGRLGGTAGVGDPALNNRLEIAYASASGVFLWRAATRSALRLVDGAGFSSFGARAVLNDAGLVAFVGDPKGGTRSVYLGSSSMPATPIGSVERRAALAISEGGQVVFTTGNGFGNRAARIMRYDSATGSSAIIAREGDMVAGEPLGAIETGSLAIDALGNVLFEGFFRRRGRDGSKLVLRSEGGFSALSDDLRRSSRIFTQPSASGEVAWTERGQLARLRDGTVSTALDVAVTTPIGAGVRAGDPSLNRSGALVFSVSRRALYLSNGGVPQPVVQVGDVVPEAGTIIGLGGHGAGGGRVACYASNAAGAGLLLVGAPGALRPVLTTEHPVLRARGILLDEPLVEVDARSVLLSSTIGGADSSRRGVFRVDTRRPKLLPVRRFRRPVTIADLATPRTIVLERTKNGRSTLDLIVRRRRLRIARSGDAAPGSGGGHFTVFGAAAADGDRVMFEASVAGGTVETGIFLWGPEGIEPVAVGGLEVPGGGVLRGSTGPPVVLGGPRVAFLGSVAQPGEVSDRVGLFVARGGSLIRVAQDGDPSPRGGVVAELLQAPIAAAGDTLVFSARLGGATAANALLTWRDDGPGGSARQQ